MRDKEIELETLKREIAQIEASLENDFAKHMAEHTDEKLEDLFFNNKVDFYKYVLTAQNNYLKEHVKHVIDKADKALALSDEIETSKKQAEVEKAKADFLSKHKDENINMQELINFYNEEVPAKYKKEIEQLEGVEFFDAIYEMLKVAKGENEVAKKEEEVAKDEEKELPKEVKGNGVSGVNSAMNQNVMTRF